MITGKLLRTGEVSVTVHGTRYTAGFEVWAQRGTVVVLSLPSTPSMACADPTGPAVERCARRLLREWIGAGKAEKSSAIEKERIQQ